MDKNDDIQVNKVSKWDAAPESIGKVKHDLTFLLDRLEVRTYDVDDPEYKELVDDIFKSLDKALDDYNELEAKYQKQCGMISDYAEENARLKRKNEKASNNIIDLLDKLRLALKDTAQHECEELDKKFKELEKENKDLKKENNNLTSDNKRLRDAVEAWFNMFIDVRHKRDFLKKEYEKLKEINKSCPVTCECENFKPKVHYSYDPLDDLPDVEHS